MQELQETQVRSLGWEDTLEKGMATHCSILVWRIPWTVEPGGLQSMGSQELDMTWRLNYHHLTLQDYKTRRGTLDLKIRVRAMSIW